MTKFRLGRGASSDAIALMAIKMVTICLGFAVTRLLSQHLSTHDYGTYSQIQLVISTVSSLTILGMMDGINFFFCSEQEEKKREACIATLFSLQAIAGTAAGIAVLLLQGVISAGFENPDVTGLIVYAAALPLLQNLVSMLQILMISVGKARMIALRNLLVSLAKLGAVLLVVLLIQDVAVILAVTLLLDLAQIGAFLGILKGSGCTVRLRNTDFRLTGQILGYCLPMAVFVAVNSLNRDADKYLIALMTDTETLAVYTNASKVLPFDIIMTSFCTVLLPEITRLVARKACEQAVSLYRIFLEIACISTGILCCGALAAAPQLLELLYSRKYLPGLGIFCVYILVDLFRFAGITLILSAAGRTAKLMILGAGTLALNVVLNLLLFRVMGTPGPAVATLVTTIAMGILMLHLGAKELNAGIRDFFDGGYLLRFAAESLVAVGIFSLVRLGLEKTGLPYFLILLIVAGGCCGVLFLRGGKRLLGDLKQVNAYK